MSRMKGICVILYWCGFSRLWGPIYDSVHERYHWTALPPGGGVWVLSVSLTSLPYPGVGNPKWGLPRTCVLY